MCPPNLTRGRAAHRPACPTLISVLSALCLGLTAQAATPAPGEIVILDAFDRPLNDRAIPLINWDGYMANPAPEFSVVPPEDAAYPLRVVLEADDSRLYFDLSSLAGPDGPYKVMWFSDPTPQTFRIALFPPRGGHEGARHTLSIDAEDRNVGWTQSIPIEVENAAPGRGRFGLQIARDMRRDRAGFRWFTGSRLRVAAAAARDWAYFIGDMGLDPVGVGEEVTATWDHPRGFHGRASSLSRNTFEYTGFLLYIYGIRCEAGATCETDQMRSGGQPMFTVPDQVQTSGGEPLGPELWRSGMVDIEIDGNYDRDGWHEELDDSRWFDTDTLLGDNDLYSVVLHEIGHAIAFNEHYEAFERGGTIESPRLTAYYGGPLDIDRNDHFVRAVDPVSGFGAFGSHYRGDMPPGRWLITKLDLLLLEAVGYRLRDVAALREMTIATDELPPYTPDRPYRARLEVEDGVPPYHWSGIMPRGLRLDSFTGEITGSPVQDAARFTFPVEVCDHDPTSDCVERRITLRQAAASPEDPPDDPPGNGNDVGPPEPPCPDGFFCAEPGFEPGECRLCLPESMDRF